MGCGQEHEDKEFVAVREVVGRDLELRHLVDEVVDVGHVAGVGQAKLHPRLAGGGGWVADRARVVMGEPAAATPRNTRTIGFVSNGSTFILIFSVIRTAQTKGIKGN